MDSLVLFFQSTTQKSWRDKLTGVYRFAREAGWQVQVVEANSSPAAVRTMLKIWQPIGCIVDRGLAAGREPTRIFGRTPLATAPPLYIIPFVINRLSLFVAMLIEMLAHFFSKMRRFTHI